MRTKRSCYSEPTRACEQRMAVVGARQHGISAQPTHFPQVLSLITGHALRRDVFALSLVLCLSIAHAADNSADSSSDIAEVVVTGTRIRQPVDAGTTTVTVITGQQLESQGYRNVF